MSSNTMVGSAFVNAICFAWYTFYTIFYFYFPLNFSYLKMPNLLLKCTYSYHSDVMLNVIKKYSNVVCCYFILNRIKGCFDALDKKYVSFC